MRATAQSTSPAVRIAAHCAVCSLAAAAPQLGDRCSRSVTVRGRRQCGKSSLLRRSDAVEEVPPDGPDRPGLVGCPQAHCQRQDSRGRSGVDLRPCGLLAENRSALVVTDSYRQTTAPLHSEAAVSGARSESPSRCLRQTQVIVTQSLPIERRIACRLRTESRKYADRKVPAP